MSLVLVVASPAFSRETVRERYLQCGVAVGVLEQSGALYAVRVFLSVEVVAEREVLRPLHSEVESWSYLVFHAQAEWHIGGEAVVCVASGCERCAHSHEDERCEALCSAIVASGAVGPEVVFVYGAYVH